MKRQAIGLAVLALLACAQPAVASERLVTQVDDPYGDQIEAAWDLTWYEARVEPSGAGLRFAVSSSFRDGTPPELPPPPADLHAQLSVHFGQIAGTSCRTTLVLSGPLRGDQASWWAADGTSGEATRIPLEHAVAFEAVHPRPRPGCSWAVVHHGERVFDTTPWSRLRDPDYRPPPPPKPKPTPRPQLAVLGTGKNVRLGRWATVQIRVKNPGDGVARGVLLSARRTRHVTIRRPVRYLRDIAPGASVTARLRVKLRRHTRARIPLRATAAGGLRDSASIHLTRVRYPRTAR